MAYDPEARESGKNAMIIALSALGLVALAAIGYYMFNKGANDATANAAANTPTIAVDRSSTTFVNNSAPAPAAPAQNVIVVPPVVRERTTIRSNTVTQSSNTVTSGTGTSGINTGVGTTTTAPGGTSTTTTTTTNPGAATSGNNGAPAAPPQTNVTINNVPPSSSTETGTTGTGSSGATGTDNAASASSSGMDNAANAATNETGNGY